MARSNAQRIGIWIIVIVFAVATVATFAAIVISMQNQTVIQERIDELSAQYQEDVAELQRELTEKYYPVLSPYQDEAKAFDPEKVTKVSTKDHKVGDGEDITEESTYSAYYIGWNPDGVVFESSIDGESLNEPYLVRPGGVIAGWAEGAVGMKVGGIREIAMPSEKAYGDTARSELIPANTPLKFIVMIIEEPETVEIPEELIRYYQQQGYY